MQLQSFGFDLWLVVQKHVLRFVKKVIVDERREGVGAIQASFPDEGGCIDFQHGGRFVETEDGDVGVGGCVDLHLFGESPFSAVMVNATRPVH